MLFDHEGSAEAFLPEYVQLLSGVDHEVRRVWASADDQVDPDAFASVDAVVVAGGPTPGYHASLRPAYGAIRRLVEDGGSYLGLSAGAMIAPARAIIGGRRWMGADVCPEQWSEGLQEVTVVDGIGLFPHPVEVHVGQAGTLGLLVALADSVVLPVLLGIDEDTSVVLEPGAAWSRCGSGAVWEVRAEADSVMVRRHFH